MVKSRFGFYLYICLANSNCGGDTNNENYNLERQPETGRKHGDYGACL